MEISYQEDQRNPEACCGKAEEKGEEEGEEVFAGDLQYSQFSSTSNLSTIFLMRRYASLGIFPSRIQRYIFCFDTPFSWQYFQIGIKLFDEGVIIFFFIFLDIYIS